MLNTNKTNLNENLDDFHTREHTKAQGHAQRAAQTREQTSKRDLWRLSNERVLSGRIKHVQRVVVLLVRVKRGQINAILRLSRIELHTILEQFIEAGVGVVQKGHLHIVRDRVTLDRTRRQVLVRVRLAYKRVVLRVHARVRLGTVKAGRRVSVQSG